LRSAALGPARAETAVKLGEQAMTSTPRRWHRYLPRLLLLIPCAVALWVPLYNKVDPSLGGIPFFYWFQLASILFGALCVLIVYSLERLFARRA
jgi:hypothetical protein